MLPIRRVFNPIPVRPISQQLVAIRGQKPEDTEQRIANALLDPNLFAQFFLQTDTWDIQADILRAVATDPLVAVKACHASSKTFSAAIVLLWFLARYTESVVVTTAPTWGQVERLLWGEVHAAMLKSRYPYPKALTTELKLGPKRYAYGLSTSVTKQDEGVKFQGIHAENVLIILDEAPGVDPKIWEAIEGARAGGNVRVLAIGNPTISSGPFHDCFDKERSNWTVFTIGAFDTPNLKDITLEQLIKMEPPELDADPRPYLCRRRWVKEKHKKWGPGHPLWESRVMGQFPQQSEDALLSLTWLEEAAIRELEGVGKFSAGIDVAGPGETETSLTIRKGPQIVFHKQYSQSDPRGEVVSDLMPYKSNLLVVNVDSIGIGWNFYTHLMDLKFPAVPINVSEGSSDPEKYFNLKAEFYWLLRERFSIGAVSGLDDEETIGQLAGIRYKHNAKGQIQIESKEDAAKRGVPSPDRAESVMLCFADRLLVYGVLEHYKEVARNMEKTQGSTMMKPGMSDNQLSCPKCDAVCVVRAQGQWRCNQCGNQFAGPGDKPVTQKNLTRKDVLQKM